MICAVHQAADPSLRGAARPAILAPGPREASFGRVLVRVPGGTTRVALLVDGEQLAQRATNARRVRMTVRLPRHNVVLRAVAYGPGGRSASRPVRPVFGLPRAAFPVSVLPRLDRRLQHRLRALASSLPGITGFYVMDLGSGRGAAWNARARFPAASTVKLAIAIAVMTRLHGIPAPGTTLHRLLRTMLVVSDNEAANELLVWLGGSQPAGAARVDALLRRIGLHGTYLYSGYLVDAAATSGRPIPLNVTESPSFVGKYTTAWDLARLHRDLHLAVAGRGALASGLQGFSRRDARSLLFLLCHSADHGKLDRYVDGPRVAVPHKAGWISTARHDAGIVYWPGGAFVAAVMTWNGSGITLDSDVLAGRVARAALHRFRALARRDREARALGVSTL